MKLLTTILFTLFCLDSFSQSATWTTSDERSISNYEVQQSKDSITWLTIAPIAKGKSSYTYALPLVQNYYRVKANGVKPFYTAAQLLAVGTTVYSSSITNAKISTSWWSDKLSWTTAAESNVNYYLISKSSGGSFQVPAKGNSNYSYTNNRGWFSKKPTYTILAFFSNNSKGQPTTFK